MLLFAIGAVVIVQALRVHGAYANDGDWSECTMSDGSQCAGLGGIFAWLKSDGSGAVLAHSAVGGVGAALGALLGAGLGAAGAGLAVGTSQAGATARATDAPTTEDLWPADEPAHDSLPDPDGGEAPSVPAARVAPDSHVDTSVWPGGSTDTSADYEPVAESVASSETTAGTSAPPPYSLDVRDFPAGEPEPGKHEGDQG
jgi:hypothetical protein